MTRAELEGLLESLETVAKGVLADAGRHAPQFMVFADRGTTTALAMTEPDGWRAYVEKEIAKGARAIVFINEAWVVPAGNANVEMAALHWKATHGSLKEFPGRREALVLEAASPEALVLRQVPFERTATGFEFGTPYAATGDPWLWRGLWPVEEQA